MQIRKLKKVGYGLLFVWLLSTLVFLLWLNNEVNQYWGAHTQVVDPSPFQRGQDAMALVNVNVLSADGEQMLPKQTVLISHGEIKYVGSEQNIPTGFATIDATDQYLIPGLIDSHVHLWQSPNDLLLYLANGVTHVREMNGSEEHLQWREEIQAGRPGPDLFVASRRHNSSGMLAGWFNRWTAKINNVTDAQSVAQDMQALKDSGFDAIKIYTKLSAEHFSAFNLAADHVGLPILGHIPQTIELSEIWGSQLKELAHVEELVKALDREFGGYDRHSTTEFLAFVKQRSEAIAKQLTNHDMAVVSTFDLMQSLVTQKHAIDQALQDSELQYVNPGISESTLPSIRVMGWLPEVNIYRLSHDYPEQRLAGNRLYWQAYAQAHAILLEAMAEQGVKVLAGTDANVPGMVPGFSMHDELVALNGAGFTASQALYAATRAPADWMQIKTGRIEVGYQADLLLLDENPLLDINNTREISAVINNGRWYDREAMDAMLAAVAKANDHSRHEHIDHYH